MKTYVEAEEKTHSDTELTLGTNSILGIFFGLALICGVFFGFGYSLGRGNTRTVASARTVLPSPESEVSPPEKTFVDESSSSASDASPVTTSSASKPSGAIATAEPAQAAPVLSSAAGEPSDGSNAVIPATAARTAPASSSGSSTGPSAAIMVQIAAVSRQEDANVLVSALGKRGYTASIRSAADNLLHVQVGPFATRDAAMAMRTKLLNDGYNAILK
ncbi:MAG TPA: SPOR domain-containing protein [Silvibacterium sp.]|nr:SPOR domain-containing protein [Silvibacterium sp.]